MHVCFVNPPIEDFYTTNIRRQPLGLLYIIAAVKKAGFEVEFINSHSAKKHVLPLPAPFSYLEEFINHPEKNYRFPFKQYYHFGLSYEELERQIKNCKAAVFFVSALFTTYYRETATVINIIKKYQPEAKIIVGGYHAALYPEYFLKELNVDFVITGEGEITAVELLKTINNPAAYTNINNLAFLAQNKIIKTPRSFIKNLDELPLPAREYLKPRDFKMYKNKMVSLIISRGCPNNCKFCSSKDFWGNRYRVRSIDSILAEIDCCRQQYGVNIFNFEDDNLFLNRQFSAALLAALINYQQNQNITLDLTAMNGVSIETLDENILNMMHQAGFKEINLSLVSYSGIIQAKLGRPFDSEKYRQIVTLARKLKMRVRAYFILGLPEQTKEELETTIDFLRELRVKIFPSVFYNVLAPQTEWQNQRSSAFFNETNSLTRKDLIFYFNRAIAANE